MKSLVVLSLIMMERPTLDIVEELTRPYPNPPSEQSLKRVPWTVEGAQFLVESAREMCQGDTWARCESVGGGHDRGFRVFRKDNGQFMFYMDRAIAEEVTQDSTAAQKIAEEHQPYSQHIANLEAEKSRWDYVGIACNTAMGPYCGAMAAKMKKFKESLILACAGGLGVCQKIVTDKKAEVDKEIARILKACGISDQACFDAITGGAETQARAQRSLEESTGGRPPHIPSRTGYRPKFLPGESGAIIWDLSCQYCKIYDGDKPEHE